MSSVGGRGVAPALQFPRGRLAVSGDGRAGSGGPQGSVWGKLLEQMCGQMQTCAGFKQLSSSRI